MPTIHIQGMDIEYSESDVITFDEGLIGLPHIRRWVLISQPEIDPFLWLASIEDPETVFLVLEPRSQFTEYAPYISAQACVRLGVSPGETPLFLAIVRITAEWKNSTINLRAPLVIAASAMRGAQFVLMESSYHLEQPLTQ